MDILKLTRDKDFILSLIEEAPDGTARVKQQCQIYIPARYAERGLASIGSDVYICGIYAIVSGDKFATMTCNAMVRIDPAVINRVEMDDEEYIEFVFPAQSIMHPSTTVVRINTFTYTIFDYYHANARVPWYVSYNQMARLFETAKDYADANIGSNHETDELLASVIARNKLNRSQYFRQVATSDKEDLANNRPVYVSLKNVAYSATNTMSKLGGNRFTDGTVSALVSPSERVESMEALIRA